MAKEKTKKEKILGTVPKNQQFFGDFWDCPEFSKKSKTKNQNGITLIALIITIIVMLILVGVTVNLAINGGIFSTAKQAAKDTERHAIHDQIIGAMKLTNNGKVDVDDTFKQAKEALTLEGKTVRLVEPGAEGEITAGTTKIVFTVQGKHGTYKYQITETEVKLIGEAGETPGGDDPVVPQGYATTLEGLGTGVNLVQYASLTGNLKTAADNGKITAVIEENVTENGETKTIRAVIPTGLTVSTTDGEDTISGGLVVRDGSQNEFVWIPVPEINDMVMCQSAETNGTGRCTLELQGETLKCTKHNSQALAGRLYADTTIASYGENFNANLKGQTYNATIGYREPANLTGTYTIQAASTSTGETGGTFAYDSQKMFTYFGGGTYSGDTMYQTEFNEMAKSVAKYGGFYVGRYETGGFNETKVVSKQGRGMNSAGGDINYTTWYKMYQMQKDFKRGSTIIGSSMIWGCQYDQVMKFVDGNNGFSVTTPNASRHSKSVTTGTGNTPTDFVANIYDLEGNMYEWTLEANDTSRRVSRGGVCGISDSASSRGGSYPIYSFTDRRVSSHSLCPIKKLLDISSSES